MPSPKERTIVLRRFDGVNLLVDQAFLGPSYLRAAQNWIPGETFRLTKTPGNVLYEPGVIINVERTLKMGRFYAGANRYLYLVIMPPNLGGDQLWVSANDGPWTRVQLAAGGNADFATREGIYDMEEMNGVLYVGNGVDPIYSIPIGGTATPLTTITSFTDLSGAPTITADAGSQILTGTYAYCWAIYDHLTLVVADQTSGRWVARGQTRTVQVSTTADQAISFPTPTGMAAEHALSTRFRAYLFVSPINLPVEFGHAQNMQGESVAGTVVLRVVTADGPPLPLRGLARTGRIFRAHLGRLLIAGDQANKSAVWGTYQVVPGLEQSIFNAGIFFPINARYPRIHEDITAIGLAATGRDDPDSPVVVCGLTSTWLFFGDILDDPGAYFIQVSRTVGCIERETFVETPFGAIFCGLDSVYMVPPGGGAPIDIGWPISPAIKAIPTNQRSKCRALYHKGFYKLAIVPAGQGTNVQQWWLDLRQGVGQVPSWWGPSPRLPVATWTVGYKDPTEMDAGFMATDAANIGSGTSHWDVAIWNVSEWSAEIIGGVIERLHQLNVFSEFGGATTLISSLTTGDLDDGRPFDRKIATRVRVTAFPGASTSLTVSVAVDGSTAGQWDAMAIPAPSGAQWNIDHWDIAQWGQDIISEGESIAPSARPRGRTISVQLTHAESKALSLRDFELRYLPVERPTRLNTDDPTS